MASADVAPRAEAASSVAGDYRDVHFDYFVAGDPHAPSASHTTFGVVLMGGGGSVDAAFRTIAERAGHGHIVILRAVSDDSYDPEDGDYGQSFVAEWGPVASAETIVFHDRSASSDPRVLAAIRGADGIFLAGGDQANYVRYWKGTPVQQLLDAHVSARRPIGGSSAGLAILGHYSYTAFDGGSMESKIAMSNPFDPGMTLEDDFLHFRGLEQVITDSHFSARCRLGRLIAFLARLNEGRGTKIYGVGIDEHTALVLDASGVGHLLPGSLGSAWVVRLPKRTQTLSRGQPLSIADINLQRLDFASALEFRTGAVSRPASRTALSLSGGLSVGPSIATSILARDAVPAGED
jgi:cyanophycinase-like exopeptidase